MLTRLNSECFMRKALDQAQKAFDKDEVPVGAVIIKDNKIIARAYNQVESKNSQLAHAEILAIQKATKKIDDWRLDNCVLIVTLEPCAMCFSVIKMSRIKHVIYGASSKLYGFTIDKSLIFDRNKAHLSIDGGILEKESSHLLKLFFKNKRKEKKCVRKR